MYENNNGNNVSYDALLSQAGIAPSEPIDPSADDKPQKSSEEKKADALKSARALADLPGMPGFLKPTHTLAAIEGARAQEENRTDEGSGDDSDSSNKKSDGVSTVTTTGTDANGQAFKVTVMVSPDSETSAEAEALREGATSSKPAPVTFSSAYTNLDPRYLPQNQAAGSGFGGSSRPSKPFDGGLDGMPLPGAPMADPFGFPPNSSMPFDAHNSIPFTPNNSIPLGSDPAFGAPVSGGAPMGNPSIPLDGGMGAVSYNANAPIDAPFSAPSSGFAPADPFAPLAEDVAAAQMAAAHAAQNAAMVDTIAAYGPDAVSDEAKKRFFGKKKREKAAQKAAEEAAAYAAATAAAAAEAAAAEEIARHQPTAYIPTTPPSQFSTPGSPVSDPFADQQMTGIVGPIAPLGAQPGAPMGAPEAVQSGMGVQPGADMSGYDQLTSALPNAAAYQSNMMPDPSVTTGMPAVGQMGMMDANGAYLGNAPGMPGYDQYGYALDGSGMTPEGVAALEAMRTDMNDASASHKKRMRIIKIAVASVIGVIAAAAITFGILIATNVISLDDLGIHIESGVHEETENSSSGFSASLSYHSLSSSSSSSSSASSSSASSSSSADTPAPSEGSSGDAPSAGGTPNGAGDEVYHYTLTTIDGEKPTVTEVVTYDENGMCLQTAMDAVFSSATAAQAFVERVRSDYGANFLSGSVDGTTAHVVVNMARSKLTREGYENALRNVVDGLEIERLT